MMLWARRRQSIYFGSAAALIVLVLGFSYLLFVDKQPSCFDGKKNGDEIGIDCGGSCRLLCPFQVSDFVVLWSRSFKVTPNVYNAVAYVENPNFGAGIEEISYTFTLVDDEGVLIKQRKGSTFIVPNGVTAIFEGGVITGRRVPARTFFEFNEKPVWVQAVDSSEQLKVVSRVLRDKETDPRIDAVIKNESIEDLFNVEFVTVVSDVRGNAIASSQTVIPLLEKLSQRDIVFTWPEPFPKEVEACTAVSDIMLLLDVSGSMNDDSLDPPQPLADAKQAAGEFVESLSEDDLIGVVSFATNAQLEQPLTAVHDKARAAVNSLVILPEEEEGFTNIGDAIERAHQEFFDVRVGEDEHKQAIVLLTDGQANKPSDPGGEPYALSRAAAARADNIEFYAIGLGDEVNATFLSSIATVPAQYYQAVKSRDLNGIYKQISAAICERGAAVIDIIPHVPFAN